jgi:hypothetical protein
MGAAKISTFYNDPVKRACDAKALHDAEYRRSVSTETGLAWRLHRTRVQIMTRVSTWWTGPEPAANPRLHEADPEASVMAG